MDIWRCWRSIKIFMEINKFNYKKILAAVSLIGLAAVLIYYFYNYDPSNKENIYLSCTFKALTGYDCPGCGGQRSVHHLLNFEPIEALKYNAFFVVFTPYFVLLVFYELRNYFFGISKPNNFFTSNKMLWIFLFALLIFGLIRNIPLPAFEWLATSDQ